MNLGWSMLFCFIIISTASAAFAQIGGLSIGTCAPNIPEWMVTTRVVYCVENSIVSAVVAFLSMLSEIMWPTVTAVLLFSAALFGIRISLGEQELTKETITYLIKLGVVIMFSVNLGGFASIPFAVVEEAITLVVGGWSPWEQIDLMLAKFFGFGPQLALFQGLLSIIGAALFSSAAGGLMFIIGLLVILGILNLVFRAVYTYLAALMVLAFTIIISPIAVPAAMYRPTQRHFKKWLDLLIGVMVLPVILFGFLWIFLGMVDTTIASIFNLLGGNDFQAFFRHNQAAFSWLLPTDPDIWKQLEQGAGLKRNVPPILEGMNPMMGQAMDMNPMHFPGIDFGANNLMMMQQVIMNLVAVLLVVFLMVSMIEEIPYLSDSISGIATGIRFERLPLVSDIRRALSTIGPQGGGG